MSLPLLILAYLLGGLTLPIFLLLWSTRRPDLKQVKRPEPQDPPTAAGYFAVCREYVPAGLNGKPPERSTPTGDVQIEGNSVYQSMYKFFDRPDLKAKNVFYVALRHDHLLLFDSADQLEVRHVISLLHHTIDLYAGGDPMTEGELFIKRNCIRLVRDDAKPFYLFSANCSDKEDFYHALLAAKNHSPTNFDPPDMLKLVQALHTSDADPHLKWLNALIGRLFLGIYKVQAVQDMIKAKITRKIDRVPKPAYVSSVSIQDIDTGDAAPTFSNIKLKELNIDDNVILEADVKYNGGFRLQIAATVRIDLGQRFRPRQVNLLLAVVLKRLTGHIQLKLKAPPSNRLWIAFESMPQLDLRIEPIVSSRQITYGVILRTIESRIREVVAETLVLPNWDDIPFLHTDLRGGIWSPRDESPAARSPLSTPLSSQSDTALADRTPSAVSSSVSLPSQVPSLIKSTRSGSFASAASPIVSTDVNPAIDLITGAAVESSDDLVSPPRQQRPSKPSPGTSFAKTFAHMRETRPMGRGQPLPAPGTPLPGPQKAGWAGLGTFIRRPPPPPLPARPDSGTTEQGEAVEGDEKS